MDTERHEIAINYRIPAALHARAKSLATARGQTLRVWVTRAIEHVADHQEAQRDRRRAP